CLAVEFRLRTSKNSQALLQLSAVRGMHPAQEEPALSGRAMLRFPLSFARLRPAERPRAAPGGCALAVSAAFPPATEASSRATRAPAKRPEQAPRMWQRSHEHCENALYAVS